MILNETAENLLHSIILIFFSPGHLFSRIYRNFLAFQSLNFILKNLLRNFWGEGGGQGFVTICYEGGGGGQKSSIFALSNI